MSREVMRVEGLKQLDRALVALGEEFGSNNPKNVLRGALKDGGKVFADAAIPLAPDDPATVNEDLRDSIRVLSKAAGAEKEQPLEVYIGPTRRGFYGLFQEFGTARHSAKPFLRPAFDANWRKVLDLIVIRTGERLAKTAKRLANKAAKLK